jgi:hypothetical protein
MGVAQAGASIMLINKIIPAFAAVAIGASAVVSLPGFSPEADASTPPKVVKSDRLDLRPIGAECSPQAWPYYEADCLRDRRQVSRQAKPVRLITTDRIATR